MAPRIRANPYPLYAALRRARPVVQVEPAGMWAVTRHADVLFVLKHPELFSSQGFRAAWEPDWLGHNPVARSILAMDGAPHEKLRALVTRAFGARALARLEPRVRVIAGELAAELLRELTTTGAADFIAAFALPLPAFVIAELLGLDRARWRQFKQWADDVASVTPIPESPEYAARVRGSIAEMTEYFSQVIAARRRAPAPAEDFVSDLMRATVDGQSLSDEELVSFAAVLLLGGFDTTTYLLANALRILSAKPAVMEMLRCEGGGRGGDAGRDRPAALTGFIEEVLRYDAPVHGLPRIAMQDVVLAGTTIPRGAMVLALIGSASRDERVFPDADSFNPGRPAAGAAAGIPFGFGVHACLGAALVRMEARLALDVLARALPEHAKGFACVPGERLTWNRSLTVRGPLALPIRLAR